MTDLTTEVVTITKAEASEALRGAAFTVDDPESSDHGRTLIHCQMSFTGADWDLDGALDLVARADQVAWTTHWLRHDLGVQADGRAHYFDVPRPEREQ